MSSSCCGCIALQPGLCGTAWRPPTSLPALALAPLPPQDAPRSPVYCLDSGGSENLRVVPASKRLSFVQFGSSAVGSERMGATINLHFEGNWMPVVVRACCEGGGLKRCAFEGPWPARVYKHATCAHPQRVRLWFFAAPVQRPTAHVCGLPGCGMPSQRLACSASPPPIQDVAVNVVGKYRYRMTSPADSTWVPLIIDIILVCVFGRSCVWVGVGWGLRPATCRWRSKWAMVQSRLERRLASRRSRSNEARQP